MVQEGASGSRGLCCDKVLIVDWEDTPDAVGAEPETDAEGDGREGVQ